MTQRLTLKIPNSFCFFFFGRDQQEATKMLPFLKEYFVKEKRLIFNLLLSLHTEQQDRQQIHALSCCRTPCGGGQAENPKKDAEG